MPCCVAFAQLFFVDTRPLYVSHGSSYHVLLQRSSFVQLQQPAVQGLVSVIIPTHNRWSLLQVSHPLPYSVGPCNLRLFRLGCGCISPSANLACGRNYRG